MNPRGKLPPERPDPRQARLAEALRANLKRRKAQARERGAGDTPRAEVEARGSPTVEDQ